MEAKRVAAGTPVEKTLDVLQKRLNQAEKGASKLTKHLHKYGYRSAKNEEKEIQKAPTAIGPAGASKIARRKPRENGQLQKSFDDMENRVSKMENTLHALNVGVNGENQERFISNVQYDEDVKELRDKYLKETKKIEDRLERANNECDELKIRDKEVQDELENVIKCMRENQDVLAEKDVKIGDLEEKIEKSSIQRSEVELQLQREVTLRQSLEDAHEALLIRMQDMEKEVDSERGQVNDLVINWDSAKQEAIATREAFESEHEMRVQLEGLVPKQEQDIATLTDKLRQTLEEKKQIESELSKMKRDCKVLRHQNGLTTSANDQLKVAHEALIKDNQKLQEALKIAATDNKALIAQHKDNIQREKDRVSKQLQVQDKLLDNAKEAVLKELEREKAAVRNTESENTELKTQLKNLKSTVAEKERKLKEFEQKCGIDKVQLNGVVDALRRDKELLIVEKNDKIYQLEGKIEEVKKEKAECKMAARELKNETELLEKAIKMKDQELEDVMNKLNSAEQNQLSQKQIESVFEEMLSAKHKLAYENGLLQSKVDQMGVNMKEYDGIRVDYNTLKREYQAMSEQYNTVLADNKSIKFESAERNREVQMCENKIKEQKDDLKMLMKARDEAYREVKRVSSQHDSIMDKYTSKTTAVENKLKMAENDNKRLAQSFEAMMKSHSKLESTLEDLQVVLGRKDNEIQLLRGERNGSQRIVAELQGEMDILQKKISSLQDLDSDELLAAKDAKKGAEAKNRELTQKLHNLERENDSLKDDVEKLKLDIQKKVKQMEEDMKEWEVKEREMLVKSQRDKKETEQDHQKHIEKLKMQIEHAAKTVSVADVEATSTAKQLKKLKEEWNRLKKESEDYREESIDKSRKISELAARIEELKYELENRAYLQTQADISNRQFEDEIEKEKFIRIETESKYMSLRNKEKALEKKIKKATLQNVKASEEYRQAQVWFQSKVQELEAELENARQTQFVLEQTNLEQEKLLESRTEDAKNVVRASRLAVNKIKSEVAENLWETRGLKQIVQSERDSATRATQKYERLMESSARKVEELAKELDRAHEKARNAR